MARNDAFVGRDEQLRDLHEYWRAARDGRGSFVVVAGEAGIGKTRLVERFVNQITGDGRVAWGTCVGPGAPPLWLWRTVLRDLEVDDDAIGPATATGVGDLVDRADDQARWNARAAADFHRAAVELPIVVVLDDLHRVEADSVGLLRLVASGARRARLLLVATLRRSEVTAGSFLQATLADLAPSTEVIELEGLPVTAIGQLVSELSGRDPTPELARALVERTGGNPFFVRELLRLLVGEGTLTESLASGDLQVPPRVRDVLLRRVAQLPEPARSMLDAAAVAGRDTSLTVIAQVLGRPPDALVAPADEAEAARLVQIGDGRLRFSHDLVRDALLDGIDATERRRLHLEVGHALQVERGGRDATGEIAAHLLDALPAGDPAGAASAALAAGRMSLAHHAPTEAIRYFERALLALDGSHEALRGVLLLGLGEATSTAGDRPGSRAAFLAAADAARATGDVESLGVSALGFAGVMGTPRTDPEQVELLEEALAAVADREDALTARLMSRLAHALLFSDQLTRRLQLADDAVELAREVGDDGALATTLYVWNLVHLTPGNYSQRLERADELLALGRASGSEEAEAWALHFHAHHMAEGADYATFDADVAACEALARRTHSATWQWTAMVHRAMRAAMQGRFDEAERLGDAAFAAGSSSQHELAGAVLVAHLVALRTWQGRLAELLPVISAAAGQMPEVPAVWAAVPYIHAELGQEAEAAEELRRILIDRELADVPGAQSWAVALAMLARAAATTGDVEMGRRVRELLAPLGDRHVVGPFADCYFGPASLYVGLCSVAMGELGDALEELERAVHAARAVGARPVAAWATAEIAGALERVGGDATRVAALRADAASVYADLGMPRHLERLGDDDHLDGLGRPASTTPPNVFRRDADGWFITYDGRAVTLRPTKGLADLHRLVSSPGTELHVLELAVDAEGEPVGAGARQPILDERAKADYRRRVLELEAEVDDAQRCADLARAERAEDELDRVVSELAAGLGFGGRDRSMTDEAERARQAVRARIRYTLDRLEDVHPELHRHLDRSVRTGTFCSYQPERETSWTTAPTLTS
jgi:tetratricopeptide (TPR) repeat protein